MCYTNGMEKRRYAFLYLYLYIKYIAGYKQMSITVFLTKKQPVVSSRKVRRKKDESKRKIDTVM